MLHLSSPTFVLALASELPQKHCPPYSVPAML
jgi:hypothetical protein